MHVENTCRAVLRPSWVGQCRLFENLLPVSQFATEPFEHPVGLTLSLEFDVWEIVSREVWKTRDTCDKSICVVDRDNHITNGLIAPAYANIGLSADLITDDLAEISFLICPQALRVA